MMRLPVGPEPVKAILRMPGCSVIQAPSSLPPETTLTTPRGKMSCASSPRRSVATGVCGDGLSTTVLPASTAGTIFHIASSTG